MEASSPMGGPGPVLVAGDDGVAVRVLEELLALEIPTVLISTAPTTLTGREAARAGVRLIVGDPRAEATWEEAGITTARAVGLLAEDDLGNLDAALLAAELAPGVPIVVRMFSTDLGTAVERLLGGRGTVLSPTAVAAPALVRAALSGNAGERVTLAGRTLEVAEVERDSPMLVLPLCNADTPTEVLPPDHALAERVVALIDPLAAPVIGTRGTLPAHVQRQRAAARAAMPAKRQKPPLRERMGSILRSVPNRMLALFGVILLVLAISTTVFDLGAHLSWVDAFYFAATTMATVGYGDINLVEAPDWLKLFDVGLMGTSAILLASFLALVTDLLVSTRLDRALGRLPRPHADHVIVCGLGQAGAQVIRVLDDLGVPCVAVEQNTAAVGVSIAQQLHIPVVVGDARTPGTLEALHIDKARALMAVTSDDLVNLQAGMTARELNPALRVVLRCFDVRLAQRLDRTIELDLTRSVAALAAPSFTAALLGRSLAQPLAISNVPLRVLETTVPEGSRLAGASVRDAEAGGGLRVLLLDGRWRPRGDQLLLPGSAVAVVGTRDACDELLLGGRAAQPGLHPAQPGLHPA